MKSVWLAAALLVALPATLSAQAPAIEQAEVGFEGGRFRPGAWTPIRIGLVAGAGGGPAGIVIAVDGVPRLRLAVELPPGARAERTVLALLPYSTTFVTLQDDAGNPLLPAPVRPHPVAAKRPWVAVPRSLPTWVEARLTGERATARIDPALLPRREGAWDAFDAVVLDASARAGVERDPELRAAFEEWRAHGGTVLEAAALEGAAVAPMAAPGRPGLVAGGGTDGTTARDAELLAGSGWDATRGARVLGFLGWVALFTGAVALLAAVRPAAAARAAAIAAAAGAFLCALWAQAYAPAPPSGARALGRCVVERSAAGTRFRAEAWVSVADPVRAPWGHAAGFERGFQPILDGEGGDAGRRAPRLALGARETWLLPAAAEAQGGEPLLLYRVRRPLGVPLPTVARADPGRLVLRGLALRQAFRLEGKKVCWIGDLADGIPAGIATEEESLARVVRTRLAGHPHAAPAIQARLERMLAGVDPARTWLVGWSDDLDAVLPADRDPVEGSGVCWVIELE